MMGMVDAQHGPSAVSNSNNQPVFSKEPGRRESRRLFLDMRRVTLAYGACHLTIEVLDHLCQVFDSFQRKAGRLDLPTSTESSGSAPQSETALVPMQWEEGYRRGAWLLG